MVTRLTNLLGALMPNDVDAYQEYRILRYNKSDAGPDDAKDVYGS